VLRTCGSLVEDVLLIAKTTMIVMAYCGEWIAALKKPNKKCRRQLTQCIESSAIDPSEKTELANNFLFLLLILNLLKLFRSNFTKQAYKPWNHSVKNKLLLNEIHQYH
jgi:hypothetical protein